MPSLTDPVVMVTGTEIADRPLRVRSGNSARARGREGFTFVFIHRGLRLIAFI